MSRTAAILGIVLTLAAPAGAQDLSHLYTHPALPATEALDRLSMKLAWHKKVPMDTLKDGIASIQLLPGEDGDEILIQTRNGLVQLMDAENGDLKWRTLVGLPFRMQQGAAFNSHSIYITREVQLYALNRKNGKHRLFQVESRTGLVNLGVPILNAPSTTPIADEAAVFIPADTRVTGYLMPKTVDLQLNVPAATPGTVLKLDKGESSPQPKYQGSYMLDSGVTKPLIMAGEGLGILTNNGIFFTVNKYSLNEKFRYKTYGIALTGLGQHRNMAYVGSADYDVYALGMDNGKLRWRFLSGSPIIRAPQATDADVFVTATKIGLCRLNRDDGKLLWKNPQAELFLATNGKFVYALDAYRFLLVLDYLKGVTMSRYDLRDYLVPVSNTLSDRVYLANHDGSIICLRHQNFKKPYRPIAAEE